MRSVGQDESWRAIELANVVITALRQQAEREDGMACLEVARSLFGLDESEDAGTASGAERDVAEDQ